MEVTIKLREHTLGDILPKYEWQVVQLDTFGSDYIVFRSEARYECVEWLHSHMCDTDTTLKRVQVNVRPSLSPYAKAAMSLIVAKHGCEAKIACIKEVRGIFGLGLKDAKELVEDYLGTL